MTTQENLLARHRILHELGRGPIGAVYAAGDRATGAIIALKRLDPALLKADPGLAGRFLKHADAARRLRHPNIVRIHDAGEAAGTAYVAMEMLEGENLRALLDHGPLPVARAIRIADEVACGLAHAHLQGLVHGDLKPSNVLVLPSGAVKVTDFGVAQLGQAAPGYLSLEQLRGEPVDHRSDVFSLGALFYEMLTRRRPFQGDSPKAVLENILRGDPPPPSELNRLVPRALDAIVLSMLAAQPAARMPGIPVFLHALQELEEGLGLGPGVAPSAEEPAPSSPPPAEPEPAPRAPDRDPFAAAAAGFQHRQITDREIIEFARARRDRESARERSSRSWPALLAGLALVLLVVGIGLTHLPGAPGFIDHWTERIERGIAAFRGEEAPAAAGASHPAAPPPVAEAPREPEPAPAPPQASPPPEPPVAAENKEEETVEEKPSPVASAPEPAKPPAPEKRAKALPPVAKRAPPAPAKPAQLILSISPRGELYIDGEHKGTTPPMTTIDLEPGIHRIEVRSGSRPAYLTYMTVQPGEVRSIRYDFEGRGKPPPR